MYFVYVILTVLLLLVYLFVPFFYTDDVATHPFFVFEAFLCQFNNTISIFVTIPKHSSLKTYLANTSETVFFLQILNLQAAYVCDIAYCLTILPFVLLILHYIVWQHLEILCTDELLLLFCSLK